MRQSRLRSRPRPRAGPDEARLKRAHWEAAMRMGGCVMCPPSRPVPPEVRPDLRILEAHHILEKEKLKRLGLPPEAVHDPRNALCLCVHHHDQHEHHRERVPRGLLPAGTFEWAAGHGVEWLLDRTYPKEDG